MEFLRKTSAFCNMTQYGNAFVPNAYIGSCTSAMSLFIDSCTSAMSLFNMTAIFSKALEISNNTPLPLWKQTIIYLSPLAIGMLPSFHCSNETIEKEPIVKHSSEDEEVGAASQTEGKQPVIHIPLMIYDHAAKVLLIASVVIISEKEGYHNLVGVVAKGCLIHAYQKKVISKEAYLITCIAIKVIGYFSKIVTTKSLNKRVIILIEAISEQLMNVYQLPTIQPVCDAFFYEKLATFAQENESVRAVCFQVADYGFLDRQRLEKLMNNNVSDSQELLEKTLGKKPR